MKTYIGLIACAVVFLVVTLMDFYRDKCVHEEEMYRIKCGQSKTEKRLDRYR